MGLYERLLEEVSREEGSPIIKRPSFGGRRSWSLPAPGAGGYVTLEDLERQERRRERNQEKVLREEKRCEAEIRVLQGFARRGARSWVEGVAFKVLQRKYPAEWNRIRWGR